MKNNVRIKYESLVAAILCLVAGLVLIVLNQLASNGHLSDVDSLLVGLVAAYGWLSIIILVPCAVESLVTFSQSLSDYHDFIEERKNIHKIARELKSSDLNSYNDLLDHYM